MSDDAILRAGIYARVSKDKRKRQRGRSVGEQETEARAACERRRWTVAEIYKDEDRSASRFAKKERPDWERLLADLDAGQLDVLVIWEPSRGDRTLETWAGLLSRCREAGTLIHVVSDDHTYDVRNARDWRALAEDGVDSAYESEKTSKRVRRMKAAQLVAGRPDGRVAYGYERRYDPTTRELIEQRPHELRAPVVREIFARVAAGDPISAITADLQERGAPPVSEGKLWSRNMVRRIATNFVYIGKRKSGREVFDGQWPALVDEATFYGAQRVLSDPARMTTRPGRVKYLCSYFATCTVCATGLSVISRGSQAKYYTCGKGCVGVRMDWLDDFVRDVVVERLTQPDIYSDLADTDDSAVVAARQEAEALRARLDEHYDEAADGRLSAAGLARVEARLLPKIESAERSAAAAATPAALRALVDPSQDIRRRWDELPIAARKDVVRVLLDAVRVRPAGRVRSVRLDPGRVELVWKGADDLAL